MFKIIAKIAYTMVLAAELLMSLRFVFKLINTEAQNSFSGWIFEKSDLLLEPFHGLVQETVMLWGFRIELISLVAIVCLMIIAYILAQMIKTFSD